eukprot:2620686-Rhodomonas_salina.1
MEDEQQEQGKEGGEQEQAEQERGKEEEGRGVVGAGSLKTLSARRLVPKLDLGKVQGMAESEMENEGLIVMVPRAVEPTNPLRPPKRTAGVGGLVSESSLLSGPSVSPPFPHSLFSPGKLLSAFARGMLMCDTCDVRD